jgi:propionaldehyde dehydrogenase
VADRLIEEMCGSGAVFVGSEDAERLSGTILAVSPHGHAIKREYIGKSAKYLLDIAGVSCSQSDPKIIICETGPNHPFVLTEMMTSVLPIVRVKDIDEALRCAAAAEKGCRHSAMMHSTNIRWLSLAAKTLNTTVFVKNAPSYAGNGFGGEGFTTFTIATPTGEGMTSARTFTRNRRCVLRGDFRIV